MTNTDLKPGYVVKSRNGSLGTVVPALTSGGGTALSIMWCDGCWSWVHCLSRDLRLTESNYDIMAVYGLPTPKTYMKMSPMNLSCRSILWERPVVKKMTLEQISKELGYEVEIVKEGSEDA